MIARRYAPPQAIGIRPHADGAPSSFHWHGRWERVRQIESTWEVGTRWWHGAARAIQRRYYRLVTRGGLWCVVYHDLITDGWFLEQVLD